MTRALVVLLAGRRVGVIDALDGGRLRFTYDRAWQEDRGAPWLSLSLPLATCEHGHEAIDSYLWNLLPDNERVLSRWGQMHHVSPRNAFALLSQVGEDCAGAVQLVRPERLERVRSGEDDAIEWLDESEVGERLAAVRADPGATRRSQEGQFSLAGAQPKIALWHDGERWGLPRGRIPTTHILKPPRQDGAWPFLAENEHLCLALARKAGLPAATTMVRTFGVEQAIVVTRFDRVPSKSAPGAFLRVHQEDLCQALGVRPERKYQSDGGPDPLQIIAVLRDHSLQPERDVAAFLDALALTWILGATDGHAKNYSLLHAAGGGIRLAPLYDLASFLPYHPHAPRGLKLAMKIGGEYAMDRIGWRQWRKLAEAVGIEVEVVASRLAALAERLVDTLPEVREEARAGGLDPNAVDRILTCIKAQIDRCRRSIEGTPL